MEDTERLDLIAHYRWNVFACEDNTGFVITDQFCREFRVKGATLREAIRVALIAQKNIAIKRDAAA